MKFGRTRGCWIYEKPNSGAEVLTLAVSFGRNPFSVAHHGRDVAVLGNLEIHLSRLMWLY
jgi:hypothetical protein